MPNKNNTDDTLVEWAGRFVRLGDLTEAQKSEVARAKDRAIADQAHEQKMLAHLEGSSKKNSSNVKSKNHKRPDKYAIVILKKSVSVLIYGVVFLIIVRLFVSVM